LELALPQRRQQNQVRDAFGGKKRCVPNSRQDRRAYRRYSLAVAVEYWVKRGKRIIESGHGRTINISNSGLLFEADRLPMPGVDIDLRIAWPRLGCSVGLTLTIDGCIVRVQQNLCAVAISQYSFHTLPLSVVPGQGDREKPLTY
jgi:hypothetical protein